MQIRFQTDGGLGHFPGLAEPVTIDTATLPPAEAARIEGLVGGADFFTRSEAAGPAPGAADVRRYTITIDDNGRSRTLELTDPVADPALNALIDSLRGAGKAARGG